MIAAQAMMAISGEFVAASTPSGEVHAPATPAIRPIFAMHVLFFRCVMQPAIEVGTIVKSEVAVETMAESPNPKRKISRKVYQRNDIDFEYFDETTGLTNLERMQAGKPPIGTDGNAVQLHHILQKEAGPMVEIREITHQEYYSQLHGLIEDGASFRNDPILNKQYNNFRRSYWKWRAEQIVGGK